MLWQLQIAVCSSWKHTSICRRAASWLFSGRTAAMDVVKRRLKNLIV